MAVLDKKIGIENGFDNVHAYTGDQRLVDNRHNDPPRTFRSTIHDTNYWEQQNLWGWLYQIWKGVLGHCDTGPNTKCLLDRFCFLKQTKKPPLKPNKIMMSQQTNLKGMAVCELPLVSCDFNHDHILVFLTRATQLVGEDSADTGLV